MTELIYDIGMHDGEDSCFYLRKGFRVVAVEADPELCRTTAERLGAFIDSGQLTIVNRAIAERAGPVTFYRSARSGWGTIVDAWRKDNAAQGVRSEEIVVNGATLNELLSEFGDAYYVKIDIEGMDRRSLESLKQGSSRPRFVSMETSFARRPSMDAVRGDFDLLVELGYDRFKIIDQQLLRLQVAPNPALEGKYVLASGTCNGSGLFGEETPGPWLTAERAIADFSRLARKKWLQVRLYQNMRYYSLFSHAMFLLNGKYPNLGWYDIHAKHSSFR